MYVEHAAEVARANNESYSALCDISDSVACSTVFLSPYGTLTALAPLTLGPVGYAPLPPFPAGRALAYFGVVKQGSAYDIPNGVMGEWVWVIP